ncbi:hypothetical protein MSAN_00140600 [Mycena sanguinolenta]|uniref:F-box domain-containing protein n=1 Tax=Mycena sanguinolenta TaxID=230812 RepID=A0A8H6ZH26_9AGAR|nr:hypothetical protein MSAN_00140600 [Mycena sanguinolenta]
MFHLPVELVGLILDEIDEHTDLKTLTLVSRTFAGPSQYRLFRSMTLAMDTVVGLSNILSQSPHIGPYVHDLHININILSGGIQASLAPAIRPLSKVRHVTISALRGQPWLFWSWNACSKDLKTALISLLSLPTIHSLALVRCCGVPAALISHAISCYENVILQVADLDVAKRKINFGKPREPNPLKHLVLLDYSPAVTPDVHAVLLRPEVKAAAAHLQHLKITLPLPLQARDGLHIISEYAPSLQQLTIEFYRDAFRDTLSRALTQINLPALPRLRSLNLRASIPLHVGIPDPLLLLIASLSALTPNLEFFNIDLTVIPFRAPNRPKAQDPSALAADEALVCLRLAHLREVRLMVAIGPEASYYSQGILHVRSKIQDILPRANAAAILSFSDQPTH